MYNGVVSTSRTPATIVRPVPAATPTEARRRARGGARTAVVTLLSSHAPPSFLLQRLRLLPPAFELEVRRRLDLEVVRRLAHPGAEVVEAQREQVLEAHDARLQEQLLLGRSDAGQVQQQRLVAPFVDVVRVGLDLVGQVLPPRGRLGHLQQEARGEDALAQELVDVDDRRALQLVDRRHASILANLP